MILALEALLRRPRVVLTLIGFMVLAGIYSFITISREARPDIQVPVFYVAIPLQGVSPEDSVRLLVKPMEQEMRSLEGLKELTGIAGQDFAAMVAEFEADIDTDSAAADVREKVDLAKAELPDDAEEPVVSEVNLSLFPTIIVGLSGEVPERTLYSRALELQEALETIPSVLEVRLNGEREEMLEVVIDESRLESYALSQEQLFSVVARNNRLVAAGKIDAGGGRFNVKMPSLFETARDIYDLPVKLDDGAVVTLSDISEIRRTFKDRSSYARFNGRPAITLEVVKRLGANIIETNDKVREVAGQTASNWPDKLHIDFALDESLIIYDVLGSLQNAIITAIALVMIVCVAALGVRSAFLVGLAIPTSFMLGFLIVFLWGKTINNMLMFGMVLTVGILVDGAIVIVEYADRKMAEGLGRREAYIAAAKRMFWPVVSSTATTLAAFLPMLFWPGVPGKFMSNLPTTVIIVLSASLITAMVLLPVLGGIFGKTENTGEGSLQKLAGAVAVDLTKLGGFTGAYIATLARLARHPLKVLLAAFMLLGGIFYTFTIFNNGVTFFVQTEPDQALIYLRARGNLPIDQQHGLLREVEDVLATVEGIETVASHVGSDSGVGMDMGEGLDKPKDAIGRITIELLPLEERRPGKQILAEIRDKTAQLPGIIVEVTQRQDGPQTGKDIRLQVRSDTQERANAMARLVRRHLETNVEGLIDIEDETPLPGIEWSLDVDREEAGRYGADVTAAGGLVQLVTDGMLAGKYRPDDTREELDIRARLPQHERSISRLDSLRLATAAGLVPLSNFVTRSAEPAVDNIIRKDGRVSVFVKANAAPGYLPDDKVTELDAWLKSRDWPDDVQFVFRGSDEEQKEAQEFLSVAMAVSVFIMFIILVSQFNSIYHSVLILSTLVMSVAGVLLGMMLTGQSFSVIMTGTGVVALAGIVVNNAIVLIDTYHYLLDAGMEPRLAVLRAAAQRLRPVLLTTVTTIFGLLPMVFELNVNWFAGTIGIGSMTSSWWVQLATAISFGLGFATLLTLILTPVLLAAPSVWREHLSGVWSSFPIRTKSRQIQKTP